MLLEPPWVKTNPSALLECVQSLGLSAAGRTDAGVHARGQVVSFRMPLLVNMSPLQVCTLMLVSLSESFCKESNFDLISV